MTDLTNEPAIQNSSSVSDADSTAQTAEFRHFRPCSPLEVLDRAVNLIIQHFPALGLLALLSTLPEFFSLYAQPQFELASKSNSLPSVGVILGSVAAHAISVLPGIALMAACFQALIRPSRKLRIAALLQFAFTRWGIVLLAWLILLATLGLAVISTSILNSAGEVGVLLGTILAVTLLFWGIKLLLTWPILILEGRSILSSLRRSLALTSVGWLHVPGQSPDSQYDETGLLRRPVYTRNLLLVAVPIMTMMIARQGLMLLLPASSAPGFAEFGLTLVVSFVLNLLTTSCMVSLYADALVRSEAWDLGFRIMREEIALDRSLSSGHDASVSDSPSPTS